MKQMKKQMDAPRKAVVDEYGLLDCALAPVKPRIRRYEELAKTIRGWHVNTDAAEMIVERGEKFHIVVGPKAETTLLAAAHQIYEMLRHEKFLSIAKVTLGELKLELTVQELETLTRKERQGSRTLKAIPAL